MRVFLLSLVWLLGSTPYAAAVPIHGSQILITGQSPVANLVGQEIALAGGNVVDVAVAVGLAMSVTNPYNASLGGGGFALIEMGKGVEVLDFREIAPSSTSPDYYINKPKGSSRNGGTAIGVPGFAAGLYDMHHRYGKLKWKRLFNPAIKLAENGFRVWGEWTQKTNAAEKRFNQNGIKYLMGRGKPLLPGQILKQPQLANLLKIFQSKNKAGFYQGSVAADIVESVRVAGGEISFDDLKNYKTRWLSPLKASYMGYDIYLMPPPSSGGIVIKSALELLRMLSPLPKPRSSHEFHLLAEIQKMSYRGRALLGDPSFHNNPIDHILSQTYLKSMVKKFSLDKVSSYPPLSDKITKESSETTHFTVMDKNGNAVSLTVTLNGNYGSGVVSKQFGISFNNEMDDFTTIPNKPNMFGLIQGKGNLVQPGKRPLSSMSPTIVKKSGQTVLALGAPGGPRIISGVLQTLYRILAHGSDIDHAIQSPRVHHQFLPATTFIDKNRFSPETIESLRQRGHKIKESWMARVNGIMRDKDGFLQGAYDARSEGSVAGY